MDAERHSSRLPPCSGRASWVAEICASPRVVEDEPAGAMKIARSKDEHVNGDNH